jgi:hypothetical protein
MFGFWQVNILQLIEKRNWLKKQSDNGAKRSLDGILPTRIFACALIPK